MGLAGPKVKTKVGLDPRNTFWTSNTERFGHKYLSNLGWTPGTALGDKSSSYHSSGHISSASHTGVKIVLKDDTLGIGAKKGAQDGECTGLLGLEGLLGRLNGDEEKVKRVQMEEERRKNEWVGGRYGVVFVRGEVWTGEDFSKLVKKSGKDEKEEKAESKEDKKEKKRKRGDDGESKKRRSKREKSAASEDESRKRSKSRSKSKSKTPSGNDESSNEDTSAGADASEDSSTSKKRKKSEKKQDNRSEESKKEKKKRRKEEKAERKARKADKKKRKAKAQNDDESSSSESDSETQASGSATLVSKAPPPVQKRVLVGRHAVRARFIAAKRSAVMDAAALNEIFMIKA